MAQATVLETIIDGIRPKKKKMFTTKNVVHALNIASKVMSVAVVTQPALVPLQGVLTELLKPSPVADDEEMKLHARRVLQRIATLKQKLASANDIEQRKIKEQLEALYDLLADV